MKTRKDANDASVVVSKARQIGAEREKAFWRAFIGKPLTSGPRAERLQSQLRRQVAANFCREVS